MFGHMERTDKRDTEGWHRTNLIIPGASALLGTIEHTGDTPQHTQRRNNVGLAKHLRSLQLVVDQEGVFCHKLGDRSPRPLQSSFRGLEEGRMEGEGGQWEFTLHKGLDWDWDWDWSFEFSGGPSLGHRLCSQLGP